MPAFILKVGIFYIFASKILKMNNHKLHLLPLFILITGLVTLTAGCKKKDMSLKLNEPRNIRGVVSYKRSFPDLNDKHLAVAQAVGICRRRTGTPPKR